MKKIKRKSLAFKIILIVIVLTFPINIFMAYYAKQSQKIILDNAQRSVLSMEEVYINDIENDIQSLNSFILDLEEADQNLSDILDQNDWDKYYISALGLRKTMNSQMTVRKDADCYFFYSDIMEHGMLTENSETFTQTQLTDYCLTDERAQLFATKAWQIMSVGDSKWLFHVTKFKSVYLGAGIQLDTIENQFLNALSYEGATVNFEKDNIKKTNGIEKISCPSARKQFYLHVLIPEKSIVQKLPILQRMGYSMAILELLLIPILILLISYYVVKPLKILTMTIDRFKKDPSVRITQKADTDEFAYVYDSFNHMADEIIQMKFDNYEQKLKEQKITMRNLQLQVKPHFLFNSFNLMYNLVQMGEYKSVQKMILYLSDYFHYINIGNEDFARFGDEFNLIQMYLDVSQIRYPDLFETIYDVSEEVKEVLIPQMLVHNFVENFIKHGIALTRRNHILIQAYVRREEAVFRVEDDGQGISEAEIEAINSGKFNYPDGKNHLGVKNSFDRVSFFYGEKGRIHFESKENEGTIVTITVPVIHKE